jgi:hypothetical protein
LLPQRRAAVGPTSGQQQRAGRALTEAGREQRGLRQRRHDQLVDVVGVDDEVVERQLIDGLGQADDDAVIAPHRLDRQLVAIGEATLDGHRPRSMHRRAERAVDAHPPVADLVAEPLDHDGAIVGHHPGRLGLFVEIAHDVVGRPRIERVVGHQHRDRTVG